MQCAPTAIQEDEGLPLRLGASELLSYVQSALRA